MPVFLHIGFDGRNENVSGDDSVLSGKAIGKVIGIQHLRIPENCIQDALTYWKERKGIDFTKQ